MIQRYLYNVLTAGFANVTTNPDLLNDIFERDYCLESDEIEAIRTKFSTDPPKVYNGFQRLTPDFPAIVIVLGEESETDMMIGDDAGMVIDSEDELYRADILSSMWRHTYHILVYSRHLDVSQYYYEIAKSILLGSYETLTELGLFEFAMSGGDLRPDAVYNPHHLFVRQLTFTCKREMDRIDRSSLLTKGYKVSGIHLDSIERTSEIEGVKANVTTYSEE